jgi:hypothetical protein
VDRATRSSCAEKPEGFDTWLIKSREKTAEGGMTGKGVAAKESHERGSKRPKALVKRFQGGFPTHRISDEDDDKVNRVIETKPGAGKPRPLLDGIQNAKLSKYMGKNGHLTRTMRAWREQTKAQSGLSRKDASYWFCVLLIGQ